MTTRFADFNGSTNREEYWMFTLWSFIVAIILSLISAGVLGAIYSFLVLIPQSAINVRRYHDIGMSGWYFFIFMILFLVPFLNFVVLFAHLYFMCKKSTNNKPINRVDTFVVFLTKLHATISRIEKHTPIREICVR